MAEPHVVEAARCPIRDQSDVSSETAQVAEVEYWSAVDADADCVIRPIPPGTPREVDVEPLVPHERIWRRRDRGPCVIETGDTISAEQDLCTAGVASIPVDEPHAVPAVAIGVEHARIHREVLSLPMTVDSHENRQQGDATVLDCGVLVHAVGDAPVPLDYVPRRGAGAEALAE